MTLAKEILEQLKMYVPKRNCTSGFLHVVGSEQQDFFVIHILPGILVERHKMGTRVTITTGVIQNPQLTLTDNLARAFIQTSFGEYCDKARIKQSIESPTYLDVHFPSRIDFNTNNERKPSPEQFRVARRVLSLLRTDALVSTICAEG